MKRIVKRAKQLLLVEVAFCDNFEFIIVYIQHSCRKINCTYNSINTIIIAFYKSIAIIIICLKFRILLQYILILRFLFILFYFEFRFWFFVNRVFAEKFQNEILWYWVTSIAGSNS